MRKILSYLNLPRMICSHLIGEHHTKHHQCFTGVVLFVVGLVLASLGEGTFIHLFTETVGCVLKELGLVPIVENLVSSV